MRLEIPDPYRMPLRIAGLALAGIAAIALAVVVLGAVGFKFDPFDLQARKLERAQAGQAVAETAATTATIEAIGARDTTTRVEIALSQRDAARDSVTQLSAHSWSAPDAQTPIDPDRIARLRDFDQQLCAIRPAICSTDDADASATSDASNSTAAVPVGRSPAG